ncbi:MAG: 50S ribosomal protein L21e [Candidatus Methanomethylicia archaeon]|nr:50S ribosomal protein L21e [Candidatus Methanomethylicia archaeon]MCX8169248.1 50S ribosomal protein L21e [Candidatus Methanomethylicia archaeon]MDW7988970.1 50S ribosomal protein L21e [Nitrososphaerota archaeon]
MIKHSVGYRSRTRKLLRKDVREKGIIPISRVIYPYKEGDKVAITINPSVHKGMPHRRYHGKIGIIIGRRGKAYMIKVNLGDKEKLIITRPEHIKPVVTTS